MNTSPAKFLIFRFDSCFIQSVLLAMEITDIKSLNCGSGLLEIHLPQYNITFIDSIRYEVENLKQLISTELNKLSTEDLRAIDITVNSADDFKMILKKADLEKSLVNFDLTTKETKFKIQLGLARGHIDLKRLRCCLEQIKVSHLVV